MAEQFFVLEQTYFIVGTIVQALKKLFHVQKKMFQNFFRCLPRIHILNQTNFFISSQVTKKTTHTSLWDRLTGDHTREPQQPPGSSAFCWISGPFGTALLVSALATVAQRSISCRSRASLA